MKGLKAKSLEDVRELPKVTGTLVRVNLNVPEDTRAKWKKAAIDRKMSLADLIVETMNKAIGE